MSVFLSSDISDALNYVLNDLENIISAGQNSFLYPEKNKILLKTDIQVCINKKYENDLKNAIHKVLIDHCFQAEKFSPGGFTKTLELISKNIKNDNDDKKQLVFYPKIEDLESIVLKNSKDKFLSNLIFEAVKLAGFGGRISIEKSSNDFVSVEAIEGYVFKHRYLGLSPIRLIKPKVICIDGYVESVSEINMLFEGAVETKEQILLICRGMHDDVLNTIKVNRDRATMWVYPIIINFDLDGINTLADISVVSSTNPVSCNLGHLISSIKVSDAVQIDEATIVSDSISIKNAKSNSAVNVHVKNLLEKAKNSNEDIETVLMSRIKSLFGNNVIIRLVDDSSYVQKSQFIDHTLRSIKSMLDFGVIIDDDDVKLNATLLFSDELSKKFISYMQNLGAVIC